MSKSTSFKDGDEVIYSCNGYVYVFILKDCLSSPDGCWRYSSCEVIRSPGKEVPSLKMFYPEKNMILKKVYESPLYKALHE